MAGSGLITVGPEVTASGSLIHNELVFEAESAADALPCCVLLTRDALRVDAKQHRHAVRGTLGDPGGRYSGVEPRRYGCVSEVVRPVGERGRRFLRRQPGCPRAGPYPAVDAVRQVALVVPRRSASSAVFRLFTLTTASGLRGRSFRSTAYSNAL